MSGDTRYLVQAVGAPIGEEFSEWEEAAEYAVLMQHEFGDVELRVMFDGKIVRTHYLEHTDAITRATDDLFAI